MSLPKPRIVVSSGEPAGVGPDLCLQVLESLEDDVEVVIAADREMLAARATQLGLAVELPDYNPEQHVPVSLWHFPLVDKVVAGQPNPANAKLIVNMLADLAMSTDFAGLVTAPVAKSVLAHAEPTFTGHTEFFAKDANAQPVMAFVGPRLRLALVTTHLPLAQVASKITEQRVLEVLQIADAGMRKVLGTQPSWLVCGLNPHAGEDGLLGSEEEQSIKPAVAQARTAGIDVIGPLPADTIFLPERISPTTCVLAMYHDQALPVIKRDDFANTVNVTFGLPFVRTSVDHGTAFELAGTGKADPSSLLAAIKLAAHLAQ